MCALCGNEMGRRCIRPTAEELEEFGTPDFTIYNAGQFPCNRFTHYMTSSTSIDLNLARREMVILGTQYAGEMKKGLFSVMHYLMPQRGVLSLHSGCNMGKDGDVALFFGLSGKPGLPGHVRALLPAPCSLLSFSIFRRHMPFDPVFVSIFLSPSFALSFFVSLIDFSRLFDSVQVRVRRLCPRTTIDI